MALVKGRPNPLNLTEMRKVYRMPPNFKTIKFSDLVSMKEIEAWIYQNLDSRYCIRRISGVADDGKLTTILEIGFEDARELTMFTLGCPYLNRR